MLVTYTTSEMHDAALTAALAAPAFMAVALDAALRRPARHEAGPPDEPPEDAAPEDAAPEDAASQPTVRRRATVRSGRT